MAEPPSTMPYQRQNRYISTPEFRPNTAELLFSCLGLLLNRESRVPVLSRRFPHPTNACRNFTTISSGFGLLIAICRPPLS